MRVKKGKKGFTLIEMILVLAALVAFLGLVFGIYKSRVEPARWSQNKFQVMQSVMAAIEHAKSANGGSYPKVTSALALGSTAAPSDPKAALVWYAVTGGSPTADISGWTYLCSTNELQITVNTSDAPSKAAAEVFTSSVVNNLGLQKKSVGSGTVTFSRPGVVCN